MDKKSKEKERKDVKGCSERMWNGEERVQEVVWGDLTCQVKWASSGAAAGPARCHGWRCPTVPWPQRVKPSCAGGCLKGARHCPQRNYFSKVRARDPSLKETAVGWREEGPLWGSGTSSFCWRTPLPSWAAASASAAQTLPGSLALHSHFYKNIFSRVNLVQLTFWCLILILIFKAVMVSAFMH